MTNLYGLTDEEKQTHLQQYNHALFQNSLSFMDIIWEINMLYGTVVILEDKSDPGLGSVEFSYEQLYRDFYENRIPPEDRSIFQEYMAPEHLETLREEISFYIHLRTESGDFLRHRIVLTPAIDARGILSCVYLGGLCQHTGAGPVPAQAQFRDALLSNSYFHFELDVTAGGLIWGDYVARDGTHPILDATGMIDPCPYEVWVNKWYELYQPQFDKEQEMNIFNVEFFKRSYARGERFLDAEVKQLRPNGGGAEFMHIFVVLMEDPADGHIHACIIWRDIDLFRSNVIERRLNLRTDNESLKRTVSRDEQFRRAALSGSLMVYNINLTKNLIEDEFYEIVDGKSYPMLQLVGLTAPCSFETFCERWNAAKVPEESKETFMKLYNRQYLLDAYTRGEFQLEIEFDTVIGRGIPVTLRNTILLVKEPDSGEILAMVNGKDVTAQRKEERDKRHALQAAYNAANRANAAKSEFLARMSHDVRTPMNAITGMTAIAMAHLDSRERVADCLNKISISSKHLLGIINEILDMSKIESGKISLQEENLDLPQLVEDLLTICRPEIKAKDHTLTVNLKNIVHEKVIGDSQHIQQAFLNLMSNAIKYTPPGGKIELTITEKETNRPRIGCFEFVFRDNGIGMSREFLDHLYEPFERATDSRALHEQGTGLGMPITRNIVQMMNGKIEVESDLNKGTTFTVTIFLKLQENNESESLEHLRGLPVLVADDEDYACEAACGILSELGMQGEWVLSGRDAVERVTTRHWAGDDYFAVILDWKMPDMSGLEAARAIRRQVGDSVAIIILSGHDWSDIEDEARAAGVDSFISKPLFKSRMIFLFNELLDKSGSTGPTSTLDPLRSEDFSGLRALMAEDNALNAEIALEIFGMIGLQVDWVEDGKQALDTMARVEDGYYDVVFMDIQMPVMNGYDAVRAIRALDREYTKTVPILAMSANAFAEDVEASMAAGMNEHIAKPLELDRLIKSLHRWLR